MRILLRNLNVVVFFAGLLLFAKPSRAKVRAWEGQTITWDLFNKAQIERGRKRLADGKSREALQNLEAALTYPENIGVGRSNKPQEAPGQYWRGKALEGLGRIEDARSAWKIGAEGHKGSDEQNEHIELCKKALVATP